MLYNVISVLLYYTRMEKNPAYSTLYADTFEWNMFASLFGIMLADTVPLKYIYAHIQDRCWTFPASWPIRHLINQCHKIKPIANRLYHGNSHCGYTTPVRMYLNINYCSVCNKWQCSIERVVKVELALWPSLYPCAETHQWCWLIIRIEFVHK